MIGVVRDASHTPCSAGSRRVAFCPILTVLFVRGRKAIFMRLRVSADKGFTLAEMVVAIGILTIATTAILALMLTNMRMSASAMSRSTIVNAGNSYIERVRALPFDQITSSSLTSSTVTVNGYDV